VVTATNYAAAPVVTATNYAAAAPVVAAAPAVVAADATLALPSTTATQYRAGDEFGNTAFGYSNVNSARQEQGTAAGVAGSYSFVDEAGVHTRNYVADALGFRVTGDNVAPNAAYGRKRRSVPALAYNNLPLAYNTLGYNGYNNLGYNGYNGYNTLGYSNLAYNNLNTAYTAAPIAAATYAAAPIAAATYAAAPIAAATYAAAPIAASTYAVSAPAAREATVTTVKLNPGHAVSYRVD
jgi:hypothetical protein